MSADGLQSTAVRMKENGPALLPPYIGPQPSLLGLMCACAFKHFLVPLTTSSIRAPVLNECSKYYGVHQHTCRQIGLILIMTKS